MTGRRQTAALALVVALLVGGVAYGADPAGSVTALEGRVDVLRAGASGWTALAAGDPIFVGDQVRTAAGGKAKLLFRDDSVITLAPVSTFAVTEQMLGAVPVSRFGLLAGTVRAVVTERYGQPGSRFEVATPTAVAGVHGTGFLATYDASTDTSVFVGLYDTTFICAVVDRDCRHEVLLGPGQTTSVPRGGLPAQAGPAPASAMQSANADTTLVPSFGSVETPVAEPPPANRPREGTGSSPESAVDPPVPVLELDSHRPTPPPPAPPPPEPPIPLPPAPEPPKRQPGDPTNQNPGGNPPGTGQQPGPQKR